MWAVLSALWRPVAACGDPVQPLLERIAQILRAKIQEAAILEATDLRAGGFED